MKAKAPRIDSSIWEQYKDEIVALYRRGTLEKTMSTMEKRHGFKATKNQYTAKIKAWGLEKYANCTTWKYVDQKMKKRKLKGKDSVVEIRGRKRSRKSIEREISRNVTYTSQVQLLEDIPTPEGIQVFTPCEESLPIVLREVHTGNLPWFEFQRDIRMMMTQLWGNQLPRLDPGDEQSATEILSVALRVEANRDVPCANEGTIDPNTGSSNDLSGQCLRGQTFGGSKNLALYVPSSDADGLPQIILESNEITHRVNALHSFIDYFVYMTNNDMLNRSDIKKGLEFLSRICKSTFLSLLLGRKSVPMRIFIRKIFPSIVDLGNTSIAKAIMDSGIDLSYYRHPPREYFIDDNHCMSIAVNNEDQKMVDLLCKEKFPTEIYYLLGNKLPWNLGNLDILRTLLLFGADPECFILDRPHGFPLIDAARSGNLEAVYMLLEAGADVNTYATCYYGTALQAAIYSGNLEVAELLIAREADINVPYRTQVEPSYFLHGMPRHTPFEIAVERNNNYLVQFLINCGAHVNVCVANPAEYFHVPGCCPLHNAVKNQDTELASFLLFEGADVNCREGFPRGDTPLQAAARRNHPEMVNFLLQHGADVNAAPGTSDGRTAIQAAAENGNIDIVRILLRNDADVNASAGYYQGLTALQAAIKNRHPLMTGFLYAAGADVNAPPAHSKGLTALQAAARNGDSDLLKNLLAWGAEINGPTAKENGITAMEAGTLSKKMSILKFLVKKGVNINASSSENNESRCLAIAASHEWLDGMRYLLKIGVDLDGYWGSDGDWDSDIPEMRLNALGWSILFDDIAMMNLLLDGGADVYSSTSGFEDKCALSMRLAWSTSCETICLLLSKYQDLEKVCRKENLLVCALKGEVEVFQIFNMLLNAIEGLPKDVYNDQLQETWNMLPTHNNSMHRDIGLAQDVMELLLKSGVDINSRCDRNTTALHRALEWGKTHIFRYLVEKGAEINNPAPGDIGTPLQEAIRVGNMEIVSLLLERGVDVNAAPAEIRGITALQAASIKGLTSLVIELLRRGASVAAPAAREGGRTAINGAAEHGRHDILQLLLNHYDGDEDITTVCHVAATYAEEEGHVEIAEWLREYSVV